MNITVTSTGELQFIWDDALQPLLALGRATVRRASHVEPDKHGQWTADLSPVGGPTLGPFPLRSQALNAEVAWLEDHGF